MQCQEHKHCTASLYAALQYVALGDSKRNESYLNEKETDFAVFLFCFFISRLVIDIKRLKDNFDYHSLTSQLQFINFYVKQQTRMTVTTCT